MHVCVRVCVLCNDGRNKGKNCIIIHFVLPHKYVSSVFCCSSHTFFSVSICIFCYSSSNIFMSLHVLRCKHITYCSLTIFMRMHRHTGTFTQRNSERKNRRRTMRLIFRYTPHNMRSYRVCVHLYCTRQ